MLPPTRPGAYHGGPFKQVRKGSISLSPHFQGSVVAVGLEFRNVDDDPVESSSLQRCRVLGIFFRKVVAFTPSESSKHLQTPNSLSPTPATRTWRPVSQSVAPGGPVEAH